ncbi:MAG: pirin family protein [Saprospiraceae bacterium]|nr:pirin family protein [Saprospiraceae bacterium]
MNTVIHKANQRGHADFGWLDSYHSFSFGNYYDPEKIHFGALRVLNDDVVIGGRGFGFHPHDNMEIISIPLEGDLEHKDSLGSQAVIRSGDVQVMSAGTGIVHSEYNQSKTEPVKFLQIWIVPSRQNVKPRYDQITLGILEPNKFHLIVSPDPSDEGVWIHQQAWLHIGSFDRGLEAAYSKKLDGNGAYLFLLSGKILVNNLELNSRDAIAITDTENIVIQILESSRILMIDVPMQL